MGVADNILFEQVELLGTTYARAGEEVTCEGGHVICVVLVDIPRGAEHSDHYLGDWCDPKPAIGSRPVCSRCGAWWIRWESGSTLLHFASGWRR